MRALLAFLSLFFLPGILPAGTPSNAYIVVKRAEGTGNTTGHVATLVVKNLGDVTAIIAPATYYIPSDLVYQSYVARIETEFYVAGNHEAEVKLYGYCADVSKPPARAGKLLTSFDKWVLILPKDKTGPSDYMLLPDQQRAAWTTGKEPRAITFHLLKAIGNSSVNWPGTSAPVSGVVDPDNQPTETAALLVAYLELLEASTTYLRDRGELSTPFRPDPEKEYSSVVQHAYWLTLAKLTGVAYGKEDFALKIRGLAPAAAPEKREQIEVGINQLWSAFTAVCTNASTF